MRLKRQMRKDWAGISGVLVLLAALTAPISSDADTDVLYGGRSDGAGTPLKRDGGSDPGGLPGGAALAAQSEKLESQSLFGGLRLGNALTVEAVQKRPFGDATKATDEAVSVAGKAKLPLTDALSVTGKMGVQYGRSALSSGSPGAGDASGLNPVYGLGLAYQATDAIELRAESEHVTARPSDPKPVTGDSVLFGARVRF